MDDAEVEARVSYMEIYQEVGYDLLNAAMTRTSLLSAPLSKVRTHIVLIYCLLFFYKLKKSAFTMYPFIKNF